MAKAGRLCPGIGTKERRQNRTRRQLNSLQQDPGLCGAISCPSLLPLTNLRWNELRQIFNCDALLFHRIAIAQSFGIMKPETQKAGSTLRAYHLLQDQWNTRQILELSIDEYQERARRWY